MCTCFDDHMLLCLHALMFTCFYVHMLLCSHFFMTVCSLIYMLWWSYAPIPTSFDENKSTNLYTLMLICLNTLWLHALMFTYFVDHMLLCSHVYLLWWSHTPMFTCFDVHMLLCSHVSMIVCSLVYMLWWLYAPMPTSFDENKSTGLYTLMFIYLDTFMIACSYVHMLCWSYAFMFTCLDVSKLPCIHYFFYHIPTCLYAFKLICLDTLMITYTYVEMLWWSHPHMHWYSYIWDPLKCAHIWFMKCILS